MVLVAVERTPDDSSCFLLLLPCAETLLLLLVSFVPSVNAVLPSLQQLHGGAGGREWLWWELVWCGRPILLFFSAFFFKPCSPLFLFLPSAFFAGLSLTEEEKGNLTLSLYQRRKKQKQLSYQAVSLHHLYHLDSAQIYPKLLHNLTLI